MHLFPPSPSLLNVLHFKEHISIYQDIFFTGGSHWNQKVSHVRQPQESCRQFEGWRRGAAPHVRRRPCPV